MFKFYPKDSGIDSTCSLGVMSQKCHMLDIIVGLYSIWVCLSHNTLILIHHLPFSVYVTPYDPVYYNSVCIYASSVISPRAPNLSLLTQPATIPTPLVKFLFKTTEFGWECT